MIRNPQLVLKQHPDISEETLRSLVDDILQLDKTTTNQPTQTPVKASGNELQDLRDQIMDLQKMIADKPKAMVEGVQIPVTPITKDDVTNMKDALNSVAKATNTPIKVTTFNPDGTETVEMKDQIDELIPVKEIEDGAKDETDIFALDASPEAPELSKDRTE